MGIGTAGNWAAAASTESWLEVKGPLGPALISHPHALKALTPTSTQHHAAVHMALACLHLIPFTCKTFSTLSIVR